MRKHKYILIALFVAISSTALFTACKKSDALSIPPSAARFLGSSSGSYVISTPSTVFKIPVGLTQISAEETVVNISVTSPTGAVQGIHYNLPAKFSIAPGKAVDTFVVQGVYNQYLNGRKDTLILTIQQETTTGTDIFTQFTLAMRGPCSEGEIASDYAVALPGTYATLETAFNANGTTAYANSGPYNTVVKNVTSLSATSVLITVTNIYGVAGWEAKFTLDFSDLTNRKVTTTSQRLGSGAPLGLAAYDIFVEPPSATQNLPSHGNFTFCQNMINLKFRLGARDPATGALAGFLTEQTGGGTATYVMAMKK